MSETQETQESPSGVQVPTTLPQTPIDPEWLAAATAEPEPEEAVPEAG